MPVRVLVVGTDGWAIDQVAARLAAAGFQALLCPPPAEPALPCNALAESGTCFRHVEFDVVVTVRARPLDVPADGEMGAVCALHHGVPLISAGMTARNPFAARAARVVGPDDDLVTVVAEVAAGRPCPV